MNAIGKRFSVFTDREPRNGPVNVAGEHFTLRQNVEADAAGRR